MIPVTMPKYYRRRHGVDGRKTFSGLLTHGARDLTFVCKNPTNCGYNDDFIIPTGATYTRSDFTSCFYNEWGNETWLQAQVPVAMAQSTIGGSVNGGFTVNPQIGIDTATAPWELNNNNLVGFDYTFVGAGTNIQSSYTNGIAVSQASLCSFTFQFHMGMMPSAFWAATSQYGSFQPIDCTLVVVPHKVRPWAAGATFRDNGIDIGTSTTYEGLGQVPNAILQEGTLQGAQTYANPSLTHFPTKTWFVKIPAFSWERQIPDPTPNNAGAYIWRNWLRWLCFGQTDTKLKIRYDDLLHRSPGCKLTNGGARTTKRFLKCEMQSTLASSNMFQGNIGDVPAAANILPFFNNAGIGMSPVPLEPFPIPDTRGYIPAWYAPSQSEAGKNQFYQPINLPMGDFVVDATQWPTPYVSRDYVAETLQDFNTGFTSNGTSASVAGKPMNLNPPMQWDVYFIPRFRFARKPNGLVGAMLAQS